MLLAELFAWRPKFFFYFRVFASSGTNKKGKKKKRKTEENYRTAVVSLTGSNIQIVPSGYTDTFL